MISQYSNHYTLENNDSRRQQAILYNLISHFSELRPANDIANSTCFSSTCHMVAIKAARRTHRPLFSLSPFEALQYAIIYIILYSLRLYSLQGSSVKITLLTYVPVCSEYHLSRYLSLYICTRFLFVSEIDGQTFYAQTSLCSNTNYV